MAWNVLILGGGFGGLTAARRLERKLAPSSATVTLVSDVNFMLYTPLLPGAAAGTLEPRHVVVPLREQLRHTRLYLGEVTGADPDRRVVSVQNVNGGHEELPYDQLIVALGSTSRTLPIPGLAEHALGFKTLSEAIALRNRVIIRLEQAEIEDDEQARRALLTLRVRRRRLRRARGARRAAGLRRRHDRALPAGAARRRPLHARGGAGARDAGGPADARRVRHDRAAQARDRGADEHDDRGGDQGHRDAEGRRGRPGADARVDRGRQAAPGGREARAAAGRGRADRRRPVLRGAGPAGRLGDRRRRRRPRPGEEGPPFAADRPARPAPGQGGRRQRRWRR